MGLNLSLHPFSASLTDNDIFQGGQARKHITSTALAKFYFFENMSESFVWLDTDIAVRDGWEELLKYGSVFSDDKPYLAAGYNSEHFNNGVMGCMGGNPIKDWESKVGKHSTSVEQHIFVEAMKEKSVRVPLAFNAISRWGAKAKTLDGVVMHYGGPIKPWHLRSRLWKFCMSSSCGWNTWFSSAEHLAIYDDEMRSLMVEDRKPSKPTNVSSKVATFLALVNFKHAGPLISIFRLAILSVASANFKMHPFCSPERR
jgi:lipopolysaccharide biosynthesis glycosyltransferase